MRFTSKFFGFLILFLGFIQPVQAFSDLPEDHHHAVAIQLLEFEGILQGYPDGTVRPDQFINRAELVKMLVEGLGNAPDATRYKNCFSDVTGEWFAAPICFAAEQKWVNGYPDGTFQPGQNVNKAEAMKIILNAFEVEKNENGTTQNFADVSEEVWFVPFVETAVSRNLLEEAGSGNFNAANPRTRAEVAQMMARILMIQMVQDDVYTPLLKAEFQNYLYLHELRRQNGVTEKLKINPLLMRVAREHAKDMGDNIGELSHASSDGVTQSYDRIKEVIKANDDPAFSGRTGENIGGGSSWATDPFELVRWVHDNIFMPEDPSICNHRTTLLSQCLPFSEVGIGIYVNADNQTYFVNDFITREFVQTMEARRVLNVPAEYLNETGYQITQNEDSTLVTVNRCNGVRLRMDHYIQVGIFESQQGCGVYEYSYAGQFSFSDLQQFLDTERFHLILNGSWPTEQQAAKNTPFVVANKNARTGWQVSNGDALGGGSYDLGQVYTVQLEQTETASSAQYTVDLSEDGWVTITKN